MFRPMLKMALLGAVLGGAILSAATGSATGKPYPGLAVLAKMNHIVVIYEENHSFDNLYGGWEGVRGLADADPAHTLQVSQGGQSFDCLLQDDVNLTSPPLVSTCANAAAHGGVFSSAFVKWLENGPPVVPAVESLHTTESGGDVRFTSSCFRHEYATPAWLTCVVCAASAFARPFTFSHPPKRLSKLWFSS